MMYDAMPLSLLATKIFQSYWKYMTSITKSRSKKNLALVGAAVAAAGVLLLTAAGMISISSAQSQEQEQEQGQQQQQQQANSGGQNGTTTTTAVAVGGGGPSPVVMAFTPQDVTINAGETVIWTNPTVVPEPHTVSFIRQQAYFPLVESPYLIANGTELPPANPEEQNTEALVGRGQFDSPNNVIVAANSRATNPVVIDAQNNVEYLQPNANYTMTGDELYVNSGFMWPEAAIPPFAPPITSFTITFENAGTYDYVCVIHPWMTGQVVVQ
jgi:plastocyanin